MTTPMELLASGCALAIKIEEQQRGGKTLPDGTRLLRGLAHPDWEMIAPNDVYADERLLLANLGEEPVLPIGSFVAKDQAIPLVDCPKRQISLQELDKFKVAIGKRYSETEICKMEDDIKFLECLDQGDPTRQEIAQAMLMDIAIMPSKLIGTLMNLSAVVVAQIQSSGKGSYMDYRTKFNLGDYVGFDYTDKIQAKAPKSGFLPPLTGNNRWDKTNATPLSDIAEHLRAKREELGMWPQGIRWSSKLQFLALNSQEVRTARADLIDSNRAESVFPATCEELTRLLQAKLGDCDGFPADFMFKVDDSCYFYTAADGSQQVQRFIPEDSYSFQTDGIIRRAWWRSPAYRVAMGNRGRNLKFAQVINSAFTALGYYKEFDPIHEILTVSSCFMPIVNECGMLGGRKVI